MNAKQAKTLEAKLGRIEEGSAKLLSPGEVDDLYRLERLPNQVPSTWLRTSINSPHRS